MIEVKIIPTKDYKGVLNLSSLQKDISILINDGWKITHAVNDYVILMRKNTIGEMTTEEWIEEWLSYSHFRDV